MVILVRNYTPICQLSEIHFYKKDKKKVESKRMERDIPCKHLSKGNCIANPKVSLIVDLKARSLIDVNRGIQFNSVTQLCPTLCEPMNRSTPGLPVHHQLPEFTQTHAHRVSDAIQPSHPLSSPSPAPNHSQHQSLFQ